jgi:hypothetical protein
VVLNVSGNYTVVPDSSWSQLQLNEIYIECNTSLLNCNITLPSISVFNGYYNTKIYISDASKNASVHNITITSALGNTINGTTFTTINTSGGSASIAIVSENQWISLSSNSSGGGGVSGHIIEDEGTPLPQRPFLNFVGTNVVVTDDVPNNATVVTVSGGSGGNIYNGASPSTLTVGGINSGSAILGLTYDQLWQDLLVPYIAPAFSSFSIVGQPTSVEVGTTIATPKAYSFGFSNANVQPNSLSILDVTASTTLASGLPLTSPTTPIPIGVVQQVSPSSYSWRGKATNTQSTIFYSSNFTIYWYWKAYWGTSALPLLTEASIEGLLNGQLSGGLAGSYSFVALDYKYFCFPNDFGSPTATVGFKDAATGLSIAMADTGDNAFYSNVQNGWFYGLVNVTNSLGIATNYRVYRTKNTLGASLVAIVS